MPLRDLYPALANKTYFNISVGKDLSPPHR